jgi:hypothetical protein
VKHEEDAERLEEQADRLEQHSDAVGDEIDEARREWEQKESASEVPGAQPEPDEENDRAPEE